MVCSASWPVRKRRYKNRYVKILQYTDLKDGFCLCSHIKPFRSAIKILLSNSEIRNSFLIDKIPSFQSTLRMWNRSIKSLNIVHRSTFPDNHPWENVRFYCVVRRWIPFKNSLFTFTIMHFRHDDTSAAGD